jgi:ubiquinone/menaquinone biosynthesis C-methylase UbiE
MNQDAIWDYFQNEGMDGVAFAGSETRLGYLARLIPTPSEVLNIGVGAGTFEAQAIKRGVTVFSLDPNAKSIERLKQVYGLGDRARVGYGQKIPFPDQHFDAVVLSEVLEHLSDDILTATLREAARVLRIHGQIIGTVPAREDLADDTVVCPDCSKKFHRWGHVQTFDSNRMRSMLMPYFVEIRTWERAFVFFSILNWKGKLHGLVRLLLNVCGIHGDHENMVFVARRAGGQQRTSQET